MRGLPVRALGTTVLLTAAFACTNDQPFPLAPRTSLERSLAAADSDPGPISKRYIVMLRRTGSAAVPHDIAARMVGQYGGHAYRLLAGGVGFIIANLSDSGAVRLRRDPAIASIERDRMAPLEETELLPANDEMWALDQIEQQGGPRDLHFNYFFPGTGANIYIVDTGIRSDQKDFIGRLGNGNSFITGHPGADPYTDSVGHGTNVAGLAAGTVYGVAKNATLHSVRVVWTGDSATEGDIVSALGRV